MVLHSVDWEVLVTNFRLALAFGYDPAGVSCRIDPGYFRRIPTTTTVKCKIENGSS